MNLSSDAKRMLRKAAAKMTADQIHTAEWALEWLTVALLDVANGDDPNYAVAKVTERVKSIQDDRFAQLLATAPK